MALPLFYEKPVVLSSQAHRDLCVQARKDYRFSTQTNSVLLTAVEFAKACHEYPIVFVQDQEQVYSVAVLGLKDRQNLFVGDSGQWDAGYIPAYVRRYPFILTPKDDDQQAFTVCIDEKYDGFSKDGGERLFQDDGEQSDFLKKNLTMLQEYQAHQQRTTEFGRRLLDWEVLQPLQANVQMKTGDKLSLSGFLVVDQKRLKELSADRAQELLQKDEMGAIYYHLLSIANFSKLVDRIAEAAA